MAGRLKIWYDDEGDYLEFYTAKKKGIFEDLGNGIFKRVDIKTNKVIGFGILHFKKKMKKNKEFEFPVRVNVV